VIFRQLFDKDTSTYTYLLADGESREAVLIDTVLAQVERDATLLDQLGLKLAYTLETPIHADHVTGAGPLVKRLGGKTAASKNAGTDAYDLQLDGETDLRVGAHRIRILETPGHTSTCLTYYVEDLGAAFTGDALFIRGCGRTDFQEGSPETLYASIHERVFALPDETLLYPGHDYKGNTVTTVAEERQFNPRLGGGKTVEEFAEIMNGLNLAYPKRIDVAVPGNLKAGLVEDDS
jgi:glyoxylase-like metal-dependent hydrolase (beta-lactamase superfamily II)